MAASVPPLARSAGTGNQLCIIWLPPWSNICRRPAVQMAVRGSHTRRAADRAAAEAEAAGSGGGGRARRAEADSAVWAERENVGGGERRGSKPEVVQDIKICGSKWKCYHRRVRDSFGLRMKGWIWNLNG